MSFTRIHYNYARNKINLWETVDGKRRKVETHPEFEYYIPDVNSKSGLYDIYGNPVKICKSSSLENMKLVAETGTKTCEISIPPDIKYLQKRYQGQKLEVDMKNFNICTIDIEVQAEGEFPKAENAKYPINLITIHSSKTNKIYTFGLYPYTGNSDLVKNYRYCVDEKHLLESFVKFFRKMRFDIITGWNSRLFDIPYIINRCENLELKLNLSPVNYYKKRHKASGYHIDGGGYTIGGLSILDGMDLYKNFVYTKKESYSLQAIGLEEVGRGKKDYTGTVNTAWKENWNEWVEYNIEDVILCLDIEKNKKHIELAINFCYQALIPFEKIFSSVWLITGYILKYLHNKNIVFPDRNETTSKTEKFPGAFVMAKPGFYRYLVSFDIESMYPHMIMLYNISPETIIINPQEQNQYGKCPLSENRTWETANGDLKIGGIYYKNDKKGILPEITSDIFNDRKKLKTQKKIAKKLEKGESVDSFNQDLVDLTVEENYPASYYHSQQLIRKILINSMYGVLGNEFFNFFNINNAMAVTLSGQELIKYLSDCLNRYMKSFWYKIVNEIFGLNCKKEPLTNDVVVLIDTDSVDGDTNIDTNFGKFKIKDIFNRYYNNCNKKNNKEYVKPSDNILIESFNNKKNKIEHSKINYVMKHKVKKRMFKIKYKNNYIIVTEDHSIEIKRNNKIISISPKNIKKHDKIIIKNVNTFEESVSNE